MPRRARYELGHDYDGRPRAIATGTYWSQRHNVPPEVAELRALAGERAQLEARMRVAVQQLRGAGASWSVIGDALGVSRSAAQKRFGADELGRA